MAAALLVEAVYPIDLSSWKTYGASANVRDFVAVDGEVWALTSGGVVRINSGDLSTATLTNADGLFTNDLEAGAVDAASRTWLAGYGWLVRRHTNGALNAFPLLDEDNNPVRLYSLADDGDALWVGTDLGLALFDKVVDGGQFQDSYQRFGAFPARSAVVDIALTPDSIIVATAPGLALADRRDRQALKSFANWTTFAVADFPALGGATVTAVALFAGRVFVGATAGLYELTYTPLDTTLTAVPGAPTTRINSLRSGPATLDIYSASGLYQFDGSVVTAVMLTGLPTNSVTTGLSANGRRFLGVSGAGVYAEDGAAYVAVETGAIPSEQVEDIAVSTGSRTLGAFAFGGFAELLGAEWDVIEKPFNRRAISISFDSTGAVWLGTFGGGVYRVRSTNSMFFDTTNSALKGNNDGGANNFIVVPEIVSGARYTYFAN
ncbi:MAG TPA: hypothetical protein VLB27_05780, partial [candidate division Zixibacteria bacterium]|nr:hypothetical protein [candidate division Zixibacteria bacterium]